MTTGKTIALTRWTFVGKVMSLLFNMLSRLITAFLPRSKGLLISRLQSTSAVILEPKKIESTTVSTLSPSICHEVMGPDAMILVFRMLSFKPTFSLSSRGSLFLIHFLPKGWCHLHIWVYWYFSLFAKNKSISIYGCALQFLVFFIFADCECLLLAVMAYDRYKDISSPLFYAVNMSAGCTPCSWLGFSWWG